MKSNMKDEDNALSKRDFEIIEIALEKSVNELNNLANDNKSKFVGEKADEVSETLEKVTEILESWESLAINGE